MSFITKKRILISRPLGAGQPRQLKQLRSDSISNEDLYPHSQRKRTSPKLQSIDSIPTDQPLTKDEQLYVLVINSSQKMANEITRQLTIKMPYCYILYSPSIEIAGLMITRRKIDLVVASSILPDGPIEKLKPILQRAKHKPDFMIVDDAQNSHSEFLEDSRYRFSSFKRISSPISEDTVKDSDIFNTPVEIEKQIKTLGADLRNDLNNPLQEIVAMVFVAKTGGLSNKISAKALEAIETAAKNMSNVVNALEDKIRVAVNGSNT